MRRGAAAALALATALAGCPLPQPLPEYKEGTSITPPRILSDGILVDGLASNSRAVILVPAGCTGKQPTYDLSAQIHDTNNLEQVEARWFVNYSPDPAPYSIVHRSDVIAPDPNPLVLIRTIPPNDGAGNPHPWVFEPYQYLPPVGAPACAVYPDCTDPYVLRVVELVVSNGFYPKMSEPPGLPNRTPMPGFETQVYRWVFLTVPARPPNDPCDPAVDPTCVKCPP